MNNKLHIDNLEAVSFLNGLVFFAPVALLVRTRGSALTSSLYYRQFCLLLFSLERYQPARSLILSVIRILLSCHRLCC